MGVVVAICACMFLRQAGAAVGVDLMHMFRARGLPGPWGLELRGPFGASLGLLGPLVGLGLGVWA